MLAAALAEAKAEGDSVGGQIVCTVTGLPAGLGGPDWPDAVESEIARHVFAIPAVKAVGFGAGEEFAALRGSQANDPLRTDGTRVWTETNHNGGINGGITNGMPVVFTVTFKPTPTIEKPQNTVDLERMVNVRLSAAGRHDSCIVLRAAPIVEAAAALAICQLWETEPEDDLAEYREKIDEIDEEIVALLAKRLQLGCRIGTLKAEKGQKIRKGGAGIMARKERKPNKLVVWLKDHPMPACVIVLSLIALIAGLLLGGVNQLTYQSPEEKLAKNLSKAYESDAGWTKVENLSDYNVSPSDSSTTLTAAYKSAAEGKDVYIYTTSAKGYKSGLELMIVVENDKIIKIMKTSSSETMGVESKESFLNQFYNVDLTTIDGFRTNKQKTTVGKEVSAVSSATKTSNAVASSVDIVAKYHKAIKGGNK